MQNEAGCNSPESRKVQPWSISIPLETPGGSAVGDVTASW